MNNNFKIKVFLFLSPNKQQTRSVQSSNAHHKHDENERSCTLVGDETHQTHNDSQPLFLLLLVFAQNLASTVIVFRVFHCWWESVVELWKEEMNFFLLSSVTKTIRRFKTLKNDLKCSKLFNCFHDAIIFIFFNVVYFSSAYIARNQMQIQCTFFFVVVHSRGLILSLTNSHKTADFTKWIWSAQHVWAIIELATA